MVSSEYKVYVPVCGSIQRFKLSSSLSWRFTQETSCILSIKLHVVKGYTMKQWCQVRFMPSSNVDIVVSHGVQGKKV